ncbi:DUF3261 domain-containing protein [Verrucomicrobia bacterium]|nr:DUF3261 domain-containing protein [Verrucomicrobiota bacterium]
MWLFVLILAGCVSQVDKRGSTVQITPGAAVAMPLPAQLGYNLTASQLVTVEYDGGSQHLPVQLEVKAGQLALAGFSSWGQRIMSLTYEKSVIATSVMSGLDEKLPDPGQVLFNVMLSLWPPEAWDALLASVGWHLEVGPKRRLLINDQGDVVVTIRYEAEQYLDGVILFVNHPLKLKITIKTLNYSR